MSPWQGTEVLLFPATAPWMNETQTYTFAKAMKPSIAIPIHDGYLKDFFRDMRYKNYATFFERENITLVPLAEPGQVYELV
jgi:L-ascorbate metabolism protein UlaG (beta-lactamase superfamily)